MCLTAVLAKAATGAADLAKDVGPASVALSAATWAGGVLSVPTLTALGQAVIVVFFTLRGVDRRLKRRDEERDIEVAKVRGELATLTGQFEASCANPRRRSTDHVPCPADPAWVE
jgi:hypothetical protein